MNVAPIAGMGETFAVAQLDRDGRIVRTLSAFFESRRDAERVFRWKRRGRHDVAVVQFFTAARVLEIG